MTRARTRPSRGVFVALTRPLPRRLHSESPARRLCFAFRSAGCARSSGFERVSGWPCGFAGRGAAESCVRAVRGLERLLPFFFMGGLRGVGFQPRMYSRAGGVSMFRHARTNRARTNVEGVAVTSVDVTGMLRRGGRALVT